MKKNIANSFKSFKKPMSAPNIINRGLVNLVKIALILGFFINFSEGFSQNSHSENVSRKLTDLITADKKITQNDYDDFWKTTGVKSREQKINLINSMRYNFILIQEFNAILWDCAEKSWIANREIQCTTLNKNFPEIKKNLALELGQESFKQIEANFNNIVKTASNRGLNANGGNLQNGEMTLEKIRLAKIKSQTILEKVNIIMQPDFKK